MDIDRAAAGQTLRLFVGRHGEAQADAFPFTPLSVPAGERRTRRRARRFLSAADGG